MGGVFVLSEYYIYKIKCNVTGKVYIGQSKNVQKRWKEHQNGLRRGKHHSQKLQRAWNKYGEDAFEHSILEICCEDNVDEQEKYWISMYDSTNKVNGFNNDSGGGAFKSLSIETREKLSAIHKERYKIAAAYLNSPKAIEKKRISMSGANNPMYGIRATPEHRKKLSESHKGKLTGTSNPMYGKPVSETRKARYRKMFTGVGNPFYGKNHTSEAKDKIRIAALGRGHTEDARAKMSLKRQGKDNPAARPVLCVTSGVMFDTAKEAAEFYRVHPNGVRMCCRGERRHAGNLIFKYVD